MSKNIDPACGSGNFLIVTYQKLRELEFEVLKLLHDNQQLQLIDLIIKVKPEQFYGIEIEDFPCQIVNVSMVLTKHLMDQEVSNHFGINLIDFPIRDNANIVHGNALQMDWNDVCPTNELSYIIGNPPFIAYTLQTPEQKRIYINKDFYFENVEPEVWNYQIGGYQVLDKYLKDRRSRNMEEPRHYVRIATALAKTIEIQAKIDTLYPEVDADLIEFGG